MYLPYTPTVRIEHSVSLPGYARKAPRIVPEDTEATDSDAYIDHSDLDLFEELTKPCKPMTRKQSLRYAR